MSQNESQALTHDSSPALSLMVWDWQCLEDIFTNHEWINDEAVCRTAPATPGLLNMLLCVMPSGTFGVLMYRPELPPSIEGDFWCSTCCFCVVLDSLITKKYEFWLKDHYKARQTNFDPPPPTQLFRGSLWLGFEGDCVCDCPLWYPFLFQTPLIAKPGWEPARIWLLSETPASFLAQCPDVYSEKRNCRAMHGGGGP